MTEKELKTLISVISVTVKETIKAELPRMINESLKKYGGNTPKNVIKEEIVVTDAKTYQQALMEKIGLPGANKVAGPIPGMPTMQLKNTPPHMQQQKVQTSFMDDDIFGNINYSDL